MSGRIIIDISGFELTRSDRVRILKSNCAGVILFARNFDNKDQLKQLIRQINAVKEEPLIICVDQEGGRVQRFRNGFTKIPPMRLLGEIWDRDPAHGRVIARDIGIVLGAELKNMEVNLTFAPVLDVNRNKNSVIGDRSFHSEPQAIIELGRNFVDGLSQTGVGSVGKHFPGHGGVTEDTHLDKANDNRELSEILDMDVKPFAALSSVFCGIMPAHVSYPNVDRMPACFSRIWLKEVLRKQLNFQGLIFSDDLSMGAAALLGDIRLRTSLAIEAGCDLLLVCNDPASADDALNLAHAAQLQDDQRINKSIKTLMDMPIHISFDSGEYRQSLMRIETAVNGDLN